MVSVIVEKNRNKEFVRFICSGHAEFDEYGRDIVCAALSMLVINTVNSIDSLTNCVIKVTADEADGRIDVNFPNAASKEAHLLIDSMILGINGVIETYGEEYASLIIKEV